MSKLPAVPVEACTRLVNLVDRALRLARMAMEDTVLHTDVHYDSIENEKKYIFEIDT